MGFNSGFKGLNTEYNYIVVITRTDLTMFLISNLRRVLNVLCFILGNSPASEFYMPTFRNTLSVSPSWADGCRMLHFLKIFILHTYPPMKMKKTECSETSAYKIQPLRNYSEESIQQRYPILA